MIIGGEKWTMVIITGVTVLVWFLAASETRQQGSARTTLNLSVSGEGRWRIEPDREQLSVELDGSPQAIANARRVLDRPRTILLEQAIGDLELNLLDELREDPELMATGVAIQSVQPRVLTLRVDEIRAYDARVQPVLPGVQPEDETIDPPAVRVWLESRRRALLPEALVVEAFAEPRQLASLAPGRRHDLELPLRLANSAPGLEPEFEPAQVRVQFAVRSQIGTTTLESVRVHLSGPHEDFQEYDIQLQPEVLRNVTISAEAEAIRLIEARQATVVAIVHLSNRDKEQAITSKAVAYFVLLRDGWTEGDPVQGSVRGDAKPEIGLNITRREERE